jgi:YidC/Oxa1 family membrane protein insertase
MIPYANILQPFIDAFDAVLQFFHNTFGFSWGWSIIALTVAVRIVLIPLTVKQFRSMHALQRLAPDLKALQQKYKDDKQRLQEETMKFYREHKVNPFGSCLPLVFQLPVFFSLYYMLRKDLRVDICHQALKPCSQVPGPPGGWGENFLFIPDITDKATGGVLALLLVLYVGSQLLSSVLMSVTADRNQRMLMIALPFVFVPFIKNFPSGLILYWITTNIWTVAQSTIIRKQAGMPVGIRSRPAPAPTAAAVAAPERGAKRGRNGAAAGDGARREPVSRPAGPPPRSPRARKKKKTGRRR